MNDIVNAISLFYFHNYNFLIIKQPIVKGIPNNNENPKIM
jgi:hypothetical protein